MELLEASELVLVACVRVLKDGKINLSDLSELYELSKKVEVLIEGIKGIDQIPDEIADLEEREAPKLGLRVFQLVSRVQKEIQEPEKK
jgi:hypothetical protein